ncbi:hypothetical protein [uncultured Methanolobus sp.]|uniref:hypothetical protein n=1 Tax=uncultured Methanolobus sp. TaxID=218300 RepID=UPI002AAA99A1|nr:hypothetical protein [uncultured Methanolobus sp.]
MNKELTKDTSVLSDILIDELIDELVDELVGVNKENQNQDIDNICNPNSINLDIDLDSSCLNEIDIENIKVDKIDLSVLKNCIAKDILSHIPKETMDGSLTELITKLKLLKTLSKKYPTIDEDITKIEDGFKHVRLSTYHQQILAAKGLICILYNDETKTWGIITRSNASTIKIRLKNPYSKRLQLACSILIKALHDGHSVFQHEKTEDNPNIVKKISIKLSHIKRVIYKYNIFWNDDEFKIHPTIDILEKSSDIPSFHGIVRYRTGTKSLISENKVESFVAGSALLFAIGLLIITSPFLPPYAEESNIFFFVLNTYAHIVLPEGLAIWLRETLNRLTSALMVTAGTSIVGLSFKWASIRNEFPIKWITE